MLTPTDKVLWLLEIGLVPVVATLLAGVVYGFFTTAAAGLLIGVLMGLAGGLVIGAAGVLLAVRWILTEARRPAQVDDVVEGEWREVPAGGTLYF